MPAPPLTYYINHLFMSISTHRYLLFGYNPILLLFFIFFFCSIFFYFGLKLSYMLPPVYFSCTLNLSLLFLSTSLLSRLGYPEVSWIFLASALNQSLL